MVAGSVSERFNDIAICMWQALALAPLPKAAVEIPRKSATKLRTLANLFFALFTYWSTTCYRVLLMKCIINV